jgi:hypothetical protein
LKICGRNTALSNRAYKNDRCFPEGYESKKNKVVGYPWRDAWPYLNRKMPFGFHWRAKKKAAVPRGGGQGLAAG